MIWNPDVHERVRVVWTIALICLVLFEGSLEIALYLIGLVLGFSFFHTLQTVKKQYFKEQYYGSVRFGPGKYKVHIHHWLWLSILLGFLAGFGLVDEPGRGLVYGVCAGGIVHGLTFDDWYKIIYA